MSSGGHKGRHFRSCLYRVFFIVVRPSDRTVGSEGDRIAYEGVRELEVVAVISHGAAVPIVKGIGKGRGQTLLVGQGKPVQHLRGMGVAVAFETAAFAGRQTQRLPALFTADIDIAIGILHLQLAALDAIPNQASAVGFAAGFVPVRVNRIGIFPHFGRNAAEQLTALQNAESADSLFDAQLLAVIEPDQIRQVRSQKELRLGAGEGIFQ